MPKGSSSTSQGSRKDDYAKNESKLLHFDTNKAFGTLIGKTREERVQHGEATGQIVPDVVKKMLKRGLASLKGRWSGME